jgi:hypothetical protein
LFSGLCSSDVFYILCFYCLFLGFCSSDVFYICVSTVCFQACVPLMWFTFVFLLFVFRFLFL